MVDRLHRTKSLNILLSADEMETLARLANLRGTSKVGVIRAWLQDQPELTPMSDSRAVMQRIRRVWGHKIKRSG